MKADLPQGKTGRRCQIRTEENPDKVKPEPIGKADDAGAGPVERREKGIPNPVWTGMGPVCCGNLGGPVVQLCEEHLLSGEILRSAFSHGFLSADALKAVCCAAYSCLVWQAG